MAKFGKCSNCKSQSQVYCQDHDLALCSECWAIHVRPNEQYYGDEITYVDVNQTIKDNFRVKIGRVERNEVISIEYA